MIVYLSKKVVVSIYMYSIRIANDTFIYLLQMRLQMRMEHIKMSMSWTNCVYETKKWERSITIMNCMRCKSINGEKQMKHNGLYVFCIWCRRRDQKSQWGWSIKISSKDFQCAYENEYSTSCVYETKNCEGLL